MSDPVKEAVERLEDDLSRAREDGLVLTDAPRLRTALAELSRLSRLVEEAGEALEPFAEFSERSKDMGGNFPKAGPFYTLMSSRGPAELNVEDFRRASLTHKAISGGGE